MQEMLLLHSLTHTDADTLSNQFCCQIDADLDTGALKSAWRFVWSSQHSIIGRWCFGQLFYQFDRYYDNPMSPENVPADPSAPAEELA